MRLTRSFFDRDVLLVAPELIGKTLARKRKDAITYYTITEVEAYRGMEDKASHARFGKTSRNSIMFERAVWLCIPHLWNVLDAEFCDGSEGQPQAVLLRGLEGHDGPGKITRALEIDKSFYGEDLMKSERIWIESSAEKTSFVQKPVSAFLMPVSPGKVCHGDISGFKSPGNS